MDVDQGDTDPLEEVTGEDLHVASEHHHVDLAGEELDAGPIIEQDVARVSHRESVPDLTRLGEDIERTVLARAVAMHLEDRTLVYENKTIVF